jgi:nucleoside-diphosphate-sugar epimerase
MRRVLIAGCGYVGHATAMLFHGAGWEVEGWTLSADSAHKLSALPFPVKAVDLADCKQVHAGSRKFDRIIHCASSRGGNADQYRRLYLEGARNILDVFPGTPLLFTSSTSVYAQTNGAWVNESDPAEPVRDTGKILREAEKLVLDSDGTVARLAGIYGPGRSFLLERFLAGEAVLDRNRDRYINQIHREDAASALFLLTQGRSAGIYNVVDNQPLLLSEAYTWLASELHRATPPEGIGRRNRKRGETNKRVSNEKLRTLGWSPRYPKFADAMRYSILPSQTIR